MRLIKEIASQNVFPKIFYYRTNGRQGPAAARNIGWRKANGEIIAFTDDDCVASYHWLKNGNSYLKTGMIDAIAGKVIVPITSVPTDYERCISWMEKAEFLSSNCFFWKSTLEKVNGFDERFKTAWREDSDIYFRILQQGLTVKHIRSVIVIHPIRKPCWGISIKDQKKNMFNALLYKKFPEKYRERIEPSPPYLYYIIVCSALLATAGILKQDWPVALSGICVWSICVIYFTIYRLKNTSHDLNHIFEMLYSSAVIPFVAVFWRIVGAIKFRVAFF
jgi:glycosyltransferase involved in cell wall biosynthesis